MTTLNRTDLQSMSDIIATIKQLDLWEMPVEPEPLSGGITNANFRVVDGSKQYFVRAGDDIPLHGVMRFNELAASQAGFQAGISPRVVHQQPGIMVLEFIDGKTFAEEDVRDSANLERILPIIKTCHREMPKFFRGPALIFWVFQVVRDYAQTLEIGNSRMRPELPNLLEISTELENAVGQVDIVFGHNDLLPANFIDDGDRIWLIDFDYAGFNSPLFDLGGLASNNGLDENQERWLLENYFESDLTEKTWVSYQAMKCASLLRESMWSMVSEIHSQLDFDYVAYTSENLERLESALREFRHIAGENHG